MLDDNDKSYYSHAHTQVILKISRFYLCRTVLYLYLALLLLYQTKLPGTIWKHYIKSSSRITWSPPIGWKIDFSYISFHIGLPNCTRIARWIQNLMLNNLRTSRICLILLFHILLFYLFCVEHTGFLRINFLDKMPGSNLKAPPAQLRCEAWLVLSWFFPLRRHQFT